MQIDQDLGWNGSSPLVNMTLKLVKHCFKSKIRNIQIGAKAMENLSTLDEDLSGGDDENEEEKETNRYG